VTWGEAEMPNNIALPRTNHGFHFLERLLRVCLRVGPMGVALVRQMMGFYPPRYFLFYIEYGLYFIPSLPVFV
jgi:hypothetical protein